MERMDNNTIEDFSNDLEIASNIQFKSNVEDSFWKPMPIIKKDEPLLKGIEAQTLDINKSEIGQKEPTSIRNRFMLSKSYREDLDPSAEIKDWKKMFIRPAFKNMFDTIIRKSENDEDKEIAEDPSGHPFSNPNTDSTISLPSSRLEKVEMIKKEAALKREEKAKLREAKRQQKMAEKERKNKEREKLRLEREIKKKELEQEKQRLIQERMRLKEEKMKKKEEKKKLKEMGNNKGPQTIRPSLGNIIKPAHDKFAARDRSSSQEKDMQNMDEEEQLAWAIKQSLKETKTRPFTAIPRLRREVPESHSAFYLQGLSSEGLNSRALYGKNYIQINQNYSFVKDHENKISDFALHFDHKKQQLAEKRKMFFNKFNDEEDKEEEAPNELSIPDSRIETKSSDQILLDQFKTKIGMERQYILFGELPPSGNIKSEDLTKKNNYIRTKLGLSGENRNTDISLEKAFMLIDVLNTQTLFVYDPDFERFSCIDGSKVATNDTSHNSLTYFVTEDRECAVCADDYKKGDILMKLASCGHVFHAECCENYIYYNPECCYCRMKIC